MEGGGWSPARVCTRAELLTKATLSVSSGCVIVRRTPGRAHALSKASRLAVPMRGNSWHASSKGRPSANLIAASTMIAASLSKLAGLR